MTAATDKLASAIGDRTDPSNLGLVRGTVVAVGPPVRVDSAARQLSCLTLRGASVAVGDSVWVAQVGNLNVILGVETSTPVIEKTGVLNQATNASSEVSFAYPIAFPAACDVIIPGAPVIGSSGQFLLVLLNRDANAFRYRVTTVAAVLVGAGFTCVFDWYARGH